MNAEVKELWRKDLLENPDKQGVGALHPDENTYCCLGRLCHLYGPTQWIWNDRQGKYRWMNDTDVYHLPLVIQAWAGLQNVPYVNIPDSEPVNQRLREMVDQTANQGVEIYQGYVTVSLSFMNDHGFTFAEIADIIEKYL